MDTHAVDATGQLPLRHECLPRYMRDLVEIAVVSALYRYMELGGEAREGLDRTVRCLVGLTAEDDGLRVREGVRGVLYDEVYADLRRQLGLP